MSSVHPAVSSWKLYQLLCIADFSSNDEVRSAYKSLALRYHPDKNLNDPSAADKFKDIRVAYEILSNEERKRKYDAGLRVYHATTGTGSRYSRHGSTAAAAQGSSSNPYMRGFNAAGVSSGTYEELHRSHTGRGSARPSRTSSAAGRPAGPSESSYSKSQQEHFRRRERERQGALRRRWEAEKREQREREREEHRREQERQEELLQRRWQQQQRAFSAAAASRRARAAGGSPRGHDLAAAGAHVKAAAAAADPPDGPAPSAAGSGGARVPEMNFNHLAAAAELPSHVRVATPHHRSASGRRCGTPSRVPPSRAGAAPHAKPNSGRPAAAADIGREGSVADSEEDVIGHAASPYAANRSRTSTSCPRDGDTTARVSRSRAPSIGSPVAGKTPRPQRTVRTTSGGSTAASRKTPAGAESRVHLSSARRAAPAGRRRVDRSATASSSSPANFEAEAPLSFEQLLDFVQLDESSEREQLIAQEEQMARRRMLRTARLAVGEMLYGRELDRTVAQEAVARAEIIAAMEASAATLSWIGHEIRDRRLVMMAESTRRKHTLGRAVSEGYLVRQVLKRRLLLMRRESSERAAHAAEEQRRFGWLFSLVEPEQRGRLCIEECEQTGRVALNTVLAEVVVATAALRASPEGDAVSSTAKSAASTEDEDNEGGKKAWLDDAVQRLASDEEAARQALATQHSDTYTELLRSRAQARQACYDRDKFVAIKSIEAAHAQEVLELKKVIERLQQAVAAASAADTTRSPSTPFTPIEGIF